VKDSDSAIGYGGGFSGRLTECRYCRYPATKVHCHGNHFLAFNMGYNFSCMIASDTLFDSRGWVFGGKLSNEDIAEIEGLRDVAMTTNFGTTLAANGT